MHATSDWLRTWRRFRPDAPAVYDAGTGRRWSYGALADAALGWARVLSDRGIGPGDRVALLAQNRGESFALLFAVAELGAILVPMNWRLSIAELRWQIADCTPRVLVTDATHAQIAADLGVLCGGEAAHPLELGLRLHAASCDGDWEIPSVLARAMCASPFWT